RAAAHAARIADALAHLPAGARFPWLARIHGVEALVLSAAERHDWPVVARAARGEEVPPSALWMRWLLAPQRAALLPIVQAAVRRRQAVAGAPVAPHGPVAIHARH